MLLSSRSGRWSVVTFVGAAVLANAGASGAQLPPGDRYLCYKAAVSQTAFVPTTAMLEDQFGRVGYDVRRIRWICNPATQNGEAPAHAAVHQVGYQIKLPVGAPRLPKSDHVTTDGQKREDRREVAVADERLAGALRLVSIEKGKHLGAAVATANADQADLVLCAAALAADPNAAVADDAICLWDMTSRGA